MHTDVNENIRPIKQVCSICEQPYEGFGNNASPINDGQCCDTCNEIVVIPARLHLLQDEVARNSCRRTG
jgi:hypothetical protein